jgi:S1-C subfamily serine protease
MAEGMKYLFGVLLIVGGFIIGSSWKKTDKEAIPASTQLEQELEETKADILAKLNPDEKATINLFEEGCPSVAYITTSAFRQNYYTRAVSEVPKGSGSGFIWDNEGHIVTNYHVIRGADKFLIQLSENKGVAIEAELVGVAPSKDLAVIKLKEIPESLRPLPVGKSERLLVGQNVYAIGNPFGLDYTLTTGIISALGREIQGTDGTPIKDVIQTDAAINPGNSGGPLLNSSGELIGVNTSIYSPSGAYAGIGFSIPVDVVKWVVPELIKYGKIKRPTLGISIANARIMAQLRLKGILIVDIEKGGAAEKAGIRPTTRNRYGDIELGDVIVSIDDNKIEKYGDLVLALEKYKPNERVTVTVQRDKKEVEIELVLDEAK